MLDKNHPSINNALKGHLGGEQMETGSITGVYHMMCGEFGHEMIKLVMWYHSGMMYKYDLSACLV